MCIQRHTILSKRQTTARYSPAYCKCVFITYEYVASGGGGEITPSSISGSVPARDKIPVIFVRNFFRRTLSSYISHVVTSCTCKFNMADANRKWLQVGVGKRREEKRYKRDVSGYDTVFRHARSTFAGTDVVRLRRTASGTKRK